MGLVWMYKILDLIVEKMVMTKSLFTKKYDRFRSLLVEARKEAGLTQRELAEKLNRP